MNFRRSHWRLHFAVQDLRLHWRFSSLFILNLIVGLLGLMLVENFKQSIQKEVDRSSREMAGGDLVLSSRMPLLAETLRIVRSELERENFKRDEAAVTEVFTMARFQSQTRLVLLKGMSPGLPFYGKILTERGALELDKRIWIYPEIREQLGLKIGDSISIGDLEFEVADVVLDDPGSQLGRGALAPLIYMSQASLSETGLIQKGSTAMYDVVWKLAGPDLSPVPGPQLESIVQRIEKKISDSAIRVRSHQRAAEGSAQMMGYLNDYLGLLSLMALLLSTLGSIYLFRAHLMDRIKDMGILKSLGASIGNISTIYIYEILILAGASLGLTGLLCWVLLPWLGYLGREVSGGTFVVTGTWSASALVAGVGVGSLVVSLWPILMSASRSTVSDLFQEATLTGNPRVATHGTKFKSRFWLLRLLPKQGFQLLPGLSFFYAVAIWQAHSFKVGTWFTVGVLLSFVMLSLLGWLGLKGLGWVTNRSQLEILYSVRELSRRPRESLSAFLALAIGGILLNLVVILESTLQVEFDAGDVRKRPSLFLFDIQEDQVESLRKLVESLGHGLRATSPMIRARLVAINGAPIEKTESSSFRTREDEQSERSRNRTFNLSERAELFESETIVEGRNFSGTYSGDFERPSEITVEQQFARRMKIGLGDIMEFDVQGIKVQGKIVGLRTVRWTSFQPNFFVQFQPGTFAEAPKVYLSSIAQMNDAEKIRVQAEIVRSHNNISIVDVSRSLAKIVGIAERMSVAIKIMAGLALLSALAVTFSVQNYHIQRNALERGILGLLGMARHRILVIERIEGAILFSGSLFVGWCLAFVVAWPIIYFVFSRVPVLSMASWAILVIGIPKLVLAAIAVIKTSLPGSFYITPEARDPKTP